jgi:2-methylcitrate dehydratase PrpD
VIPVASSYTLIERLASHLQRPVDAATRTRARLHLLDWLACVAGARGSVVDKHVLAEPSAVTKAAFLGNVLEMDDVHRAALLHPGPVIWPTVIFSNSPTLDHALEAAVRGYEAMIAVGSSLDGHHYAHWHPTATMGVFGAAAAAADLLEDGQPAVANALALAGSVTGGFWAMRHEDVLAKQWHTAHAVETGRRAAFFARYGVTGPLAVLEGPQGLYAAMTREPKPMAFPDQWCIHEVSFKPWAACRHAHPVIDCALELRAQGKLEAPFHVETYADAIAFCDRPDPVTEVDAKFSLQHAVAVIADGREATPADFTPDAIAALAPLRAQVTVAEAPEITACYPAHFGARLNGLELADCRGDPERPVTEQDIVAKMAMLAEWGGLAPSEAERACRLALEGDDAGAISAMLGEWLT